MQSQMTQSDTQLRPLDCSELDQVSGGNPILIGIGRFAIARVTGKAAGHAAASDPVSVFINAEIAKEACADGVKSVSRTGYVCN